jgi:hypothetical protein
LAPELLGALHESKKEPWRILSASAAVIRAGRNEMQVDGQVGATQYTRLSALVCEPMRSWAAWQLSANFRTSEPITFRSKAAIA